MFDTKVSIRGSVFESARRRSASTDNLSRDLFLIAENPRSQRYVLGNIKIFLTSLCCRDQRIQPFGPLVNTLETSCYPVKANELRYRTVMSPGQYLILDTIGGTAAYSEHWT